MMSQPASTFRSANRFRSASIFRSAATLIFSLLCYSLLLCSTLLPGHTLSAHIKPIHTSESSSPKEVIEITATVYVPANQIQLKIIITTEGETAQSTYEKHQERENFLTDQLKNIDISEEQIQYQPIQIRPFTQRDRTKLIRTSQMVQITIKETETYINLQQLLIQEGFDTFSASFSSDGLEQAKLDALEEAVEEAGRIAATLTAAAGVKLGGIQSVVYGAGSGRPPVMPRAELALSDASAGLMEFAQQIPVHQTVTVVYSFADVSD